MEDASRNGGADTPLAYAIDAIAAEYEKADTRLAELDQQLHTAKDEQARLGRALKALAPEHPALPVPASKGPGRPRKHVKPEEQREVRIVPEKFRTVWDWIQEQGEEEFTRAQAVKSLHDWVSHETVRRGLVILRKAEAIRLVGTRKVGRGIPSEAFRLLDVEAGNRAEEENAARFRGPVAGTHS
jgi:hypothetical protein